MVECVAGCRGVGGEHLLFSGDDSVPQLNSSDSTLAGRRPYYHHRFGDGGGSRFPIRPFLKRMREAVFFFFGVSLE